METSTPPKNILLRLPYELLLDVFRELPDQSSVHDLACTHPILQTVHRENRDSIEKAVKNNFIEEFVQKAPLLSLTCFDPLWQSPPAGSASLMIMQIASKLNSTSELIYRQDDICFFKARFCPGTVPASGMNWGLRDYIRNYYRAAGELRAMGFFAEARNLDSWVNEMYTPNARTARLGVYNKHGKYMFSMPAISDIKVLVAVDHWCTLFLSYMAGGPPTPNLSSRFAPKFSARVQSFALRYMRVRGDTNIWKWFSRRNKSLVFLTMSPDMSRLFDIPHEVCRMGIRDFVHDDEKKRTRG